NLLDPDKSPPLLRRIGAREWLPVTSVRALCEDHLGNIWLGGFDGGLAKISGDTSEGKTLQVFTTSDGLPDNRIRSIMEDSTGRIFVGTRLGGLAIRDKDAFRTLTAKEGLLSNTIWCMATDTKGRIWMGSDLGVQSFDPNLNGDFWTHKEFFGSPVGCCGVYKDLYVWQTTPEELIIYAYPEKGRTYLPQPPVYITRITVNGTRAQSDRALQLTHDQNNISLSFVGLSFKDERANRYRYRLLDNDRDWQPPVKQTSVTYAALKPGEYRFEVKAINADGAESMTPATFAFTILSPFWMRWWFIVLVNVAVFALIALGYRYRMSQLLKIERMRTRIASDLHDDIGASLTRIAMFSEVAKEEAAQSSPRLTEMAEKIGTNARELLDAVGTLVWSIDPRHDRFEDVISHLKSFAQEMLSMKGIEFTVNVQREAARLRLPLEARKNFLLIFKEAINNIIKHAACRNVEIDLTLRERVFRMRISDDGRGIASTILRPGHGLMNMKTRARNIGATLDIETSKSTGTAILLQLPVRDRDMA
ncbi:MAG TPA: two-component regulator propeller domain-containing protein, partial [Bacteroidota bacterium]|nr:two-component regulator propeller domain-containing protein [Bacteroidota bacterium]